ncbi:MAG: DUF6488 family protein [Gammaproteobacteria bacterium]|nr:DUF6488 family protein [Gammaproteobacteria bacterium]MDH5728308.1 DUF6488 family protein [Gammaproteobacteria bacterium]
MLKHLLFIGLFSLAFPCFATGPGHLAHKHKQGYIDYYKAKERGKLIVEKLVQRGSLPKSWAMANEIEADTKTYKEITEWVISVYNPAILDRSKRTLYIFLSLKGDYVAANFTGE